MTAPTEGPLLRGNMKYSRAEIEARLWSRARLTLPSGCWEWTHGISRSGYGVINVERKQAQAHRLAYEMVFGEIPATFYVLHSCDNRRCINPAHLSAGTPAENSRQMVERGRSRVSRARRRSWVLSPDEVGEIRRRWASEGVSQRELGREFGVTPDAIRRVVYRHTWKDIP